MDEQHPIRVILLALLAVSIPTTEACADKLKAAREAAEFVFRKFGAKAAGESAEQLAPKIARAVVRHGDEALPAIRRVGSKAIRYADEAGEHGPHVMRLLARHGDEAAVIARNPEALALAARYGDDAAEALIRTHGAATPLIAKFGGEAIRALKELDPRSARRLAMLDEGGDLARIGRTDELLGVLGRHGQAAMDFLWDNKASLTVGVTLTAFLADPEPFLDGTATLAGSVAETLGEHAVEPVFTAVVPAVGATARTAMWTATLLIALAGAGLGGMLLSGRWRRALLLLRLFPGVLSRFRPGNEGRRASN